MTLHLHDLLLFPFVPEYIMQHEALPAKKSEQRKLFLAVNKLIIINILKIPQVPHFYVRCPSIPG